MTSSLNEHVPGRNPEADVDPELRAERGVLAHARRCLEAMRRRAESLKATGGDWVSEEALQWSLQQRVASLTDDGNTALFFGRIDYDDRVRDDRVHEAEDAGEAAGLAGARFYLGRRHVIDDQGDPVVIDWRAELAHPFYRASPRRRYGVRRRRRYGWREGVLTGFQDERLDRPEDEEIGARALREEIERPRVGPMRDIVATIQPEQDDLIRAPLGDTICIQGGPGTGKTAVALHRVAFLLYEHRERLERDGVLVVGPSSAYLAFIRDVLPGLGEVRVAQVSLERLVSGIEPSGADSPGAAALKGDVRMAEVIRRATFRHLRWPTAPLRLRYGSRVVEVPAAVLRSEIATQLRRGVRWSPARDHLRRFLVEYCHRQLEATDGLTAFDSARDVERTLGSTGELRRFLDRTWPLLDPAKVVYRLLADRAVLAGAAEGVLDEGEQRRLAWPKRPRGGWKAARWSVADAFLIDEATDVISGLRTYGHVVADEAQDYSPLQLRAIGRRCRYGSATLLGDLAQGTTPWALARWEDGLELVGRPDPHIEVLPRAFRAPRQVLDFANRLLPVIAPQLRPAASVRDLPGSLEVRAASPERIEEEWLAALADALADEGSVGLIVADHRVGDARAALERQHLDYRMVERFDLATPLSLVPASVVKGLEFDQVVLLEPAEIAADGNLDGDGNGDRQSLRRLYIAMTRAVSRLCIVHAQPLPAPLSPLSRTETTSPSLAGVTSTSNPSDRITIAPG